MNKNPKVALVHDWLVNPGGSERVLESLSVIYPEAPIYTLVYDPSNFKSSPISNRKVFTSKLNKLPFARTGYRAYIPLMPFAIEQFDLREFEIIISSSHAVAHGILPRPNQLHINYIHSPARYAWHQYHDYLANRRIGRVKKWLSRPMLHYLRLWDFAAAARVDYFVANSKWTAATVMRAYRRNADVIYPPIMLNNFDHAQDRENYYITVSRLVPYKRMDLIVKAFSKLGYPLVIVGDGPERRFLTSIASPNIRFCGDLPDIEVAKLLGKAKAFVFAAEEDFGIALVEAQAAGCPIITFRGGGALETVIEGKTGIFFDEQEQLSLEEAAERFELDAYSFDGEVIRENAERFSHKKFELDFSKYVGKKWLDFYSNLDQGV